MATSSISGLASGLDTASIVSQLIALERNSQTLLRTRLNTEQSNVKSLQDLNSKLASLATSSEKLAKNDAWNAVTTTSSSDKVTATATSSATAGAISFTVKQLASAHTVSFNDTARLTDVVVGGDPHRVQLTIGGETREIDAGDGTLSGLVNGINAAGTGIRAGLVKTGQDADGQDVYRLRVTAAATGVAGEFSLRASDSTAILGDSTLVTQGQDAVIQVGQDEITSGSNTFSGVLNGLDVTLKTGLEPGTNVDLTITQDTEAIAKSVKELVDTVNSLISSMDSLTAYSSSTSRTGTLSGDSQVRSVRNALLNAVYPSDGTSMAELGIQTDRYGKLVLDETKLAAAIQADPATVAAAFTTGTSPGFAERIRTVAKGASDSVNGTITSAITGRNSTISRLEVSIEDWDRRLQLREQTLTRQYTAMETALSSLNSQSSWLSSQVSSLSSSSE